jgi:spore germination protein (amino acid permease)
MRQMINNRQLVFLLYITIITTSVINVAKIQSTSSGHGAWIPLLCSGLIYGILAVLIIKLKRTFAGDTLFEYSGKLVGKFGAYVLAVVYTVFFILFSSYYCITFFHMVRANFLPKTPEWLLLLISMPVLGFIAHKGFTNCGRLAELVGSVYLAVTLILFATMLHQGRISNDLPLFVRSETGKYFSAIKNTLNEFAGASLLTLIPTAKADKKRSRIIFLMYIAIALYYILDVYGSWAMVGMDETSHYNYPLIDAIRLVEYKKVEFLQRVDITYQTIGFIQIFAAKGIVYLCIVEYMCKLFPKARRLVIVVITGILAYSIDVFALGIPNISNRLFAIRSYYSLVVSFVIPCALLIIAKVKKNGKQNG